MALGPHSSFASYGGGYMDALPKEGGYYGGPGGKKSSSWRAVFIVAVIVLITALAVLGAILLSYFQGQQKYDSLTQYYTEAEDPLNASIDWASLLESNPETVGWVYIPNTDINYPVVKGSDNDYYLSHDFNGDEGWLASFGAVFMDYRNNPNWTDQSYFLYGHHMNDGSMFADIAAMADQAYFDDARTVYLYSPSGNFELHSYSLIHCSAYDPLVQIMFPDADAMTAYVQDKMDRSVVAIGDVAPAQDITKSFAFSTCDNYSMGRYVLFTYIERTTVFNLDYDRQSTPKPGDAASGVSDKRS